MQRTLTAATLAASLVFSGAASASASANITFYDPPATTIAVDTSGALSDGMLLSVWLGPFESQTVDIDYTVVLSADGLPASRQWTYCSPTFPVHYCGPAPTGSELAEAAIFLTFSTETGQDGFIGYTGSDPAIFDLSSGTATYQGTLNFTVTELHGRRAAPGARLPAGRRVRRRRQRRPRAGVAGPVARRHGGDRPEASRQWKRPCRSMTCGEPSTSLKALLFLAGAQDRHSANLTESTPPIPQHHFAAPER